MPMRRAKWGKWLLSPVTQSMSAGANGYGESSTALMTRHFQVWRVGSSYNGGPGGVPAVISGPLQGDELNAQGVHVGSNYHYHYRDHGNHGIK